MFKKYCFVLVAVAVAVSLSVASTARAGMLDVRVDFAKGTAGGETPDPVGNWNTLDPVPTSTVTLDDFNTGSPSSATLTFAGGWADSSRVRNWDTDNPGPSWLDTLKDAAMDYFYIPGDGSGTLTIGGLSDTKVYDIELISSKDDPTPDGPGTYAIGSDSKTFEAGADGYVAGNWMTWATVSPSSGSITMSMASVGSTGRVRINALRVAEVPEPSTVLLLWGWADCRWRPAPGVGAGRFC